MAKAVTSVKTPPKVLATLFTKCCTASWLRLVRYSDNTGTKACEKAPSANKRRKKLGILKATKKASASACEPK